MGTYGENERDSYADVHIFKVTVTTRSTRELVRRISSSQVDSCRMCGGCGSRSG
jgi:hypothetical protein